MLLQAWRYLKLLLSTATSVSRRSICCQPPSLNSSASHVQDTFAKEGLQYSMDGKTGSTINSHRLIHLAGQQSTEKQDKLVEALFKAYFTQVRP